MTALTRFGHLGASLHLLSARQLAGRPLITPAILGFLLKHSRGTRFHVVPRKVAGKLPLNVLNPGGFRLRLLRETGKRSLDELEIDLIGTKP